MKKIPIFNPITPGGGHFVPADFSTLFFSKFQLKTMVWNFMTFNVHE